MHGITKLREEHFVLRTETRGTEHQKNEHYSIP